MEKRAHPLRMTGLLLLLLCALAMPLVSVLFTPLPDWVPAAVCLLLLPAGLWAARGARRKRGSVLCLVLMCLAMAFSLIAGYFNPYWNNCTAADAEYPETLSREEALEDLDYAVKFLRRRHPAALGGLPAEAEAAYLSAREELSGRDTVSAAELFRAVEQVFSTFGDAHTSCTPAIDYTRPRQLLDCLWTHESVTLLTVNGKTRTEWLESHGQYISYETEAWGTQQMVSLLKYRSGLEALGIPVEEGVTYTLLADGEEVSFTCGPEDFLTWAAWYETRGITPETGSDAFVSYTLDTQHSLAVLTLRECHWNRYYRDTLEEMFRAVRREGIRNVAVDLRGNGGGNSLAANEFLRYLDTDSYRVTVTRQWRLGPVVLRNGRAEAVRQNHQYQDLLFQGEVYVLTDTGTFSSAMQFAEYIRDNDLGTLIGEAPGNDPNGYGDITRCRLPNSGLLLSVSTKAFGRADSEADTALVEPDIPCAADEAVETLYAVLKGDRGA